MNKSRTCQWSVLMSSVTCAFTPVFPRYTSVKVTLAFFQPVKIKLTWLACLVYCCDWEYVFSNFNLNWLENDINNRKQQCPDETRKLSSQPETFAVLPFP